MELSWMERGACDGHKAVSLSPPTHNAPAHTGLAPSLQQSHPSPSSQPPSLLQNRILGAPHTHQPCTTSHMA